MRKDYIFKWFSREEIVAEVLITTCKDEYIDGNIIKTEKIAYTYDPIYGLYPVPNDGMWKYIGTYNRENGVTKLTSGEFSFYNGDSHWCNKWKQDTTIHKEWNIQGDLISYYESWAVGKPKWESYHHFYNEQGKKYKTIFERDSIKEKEEEYDNYGNKTKAIYKNGDTFIHKYEYDYQGRMTKDICTSIKSSVSTSTIEEHVYEKNKETIIFTDENGKKNISTILYDDTGNKLSHKWMGKDGNWATYCWKYDNLGNMIYEKVRRDVKWHEDEYKYDSFGNWVEKKTYIDGVYSYITTREIQYI